MRIYNVLGSWEWFEDPSFSIPSEITKITGITDEMVAGHRIDNCALGDLLSRGVLVIAHNAGFDRRFLERRVPAFAGRPLSGGSMANKHTSFSIYLPSFYWISGQF